VNLAAIEAFPEDGEIDRELVKKQGLKGMVECSWGQLEPGPFIDNWHIQEICDHLEAVTAGEIKRLIINIPPGFMKSLLVSVMWPLWVWTVDPGHKWIYASYDAGLSLRDARKMRNIIESTWWRARWPEVRLPIQSSRSAKEFDNNHGGFRFSTSVAGGATGRHSHTQVVDDPHKPLDLEDSIGESRKAIESAVAWWTGTMSNRIADPNRFARVIVMQRLHENDLTGAMLEKMQEDGEQYEQLRLPMRFEPKTHCVTSVGLDHRTQDGELLWKNRFDEPAVISLEKGLQSTRNISSQLQQRPSPAGGNIIKTEWIKEYGVPGSRFEKLPHLSSMRLEQSWDCTFKGKDTSDYVVGQVWGFIDQYAFLLDQVRGQWSFLKTIREFEVLCSKWPTAWVKRVEDKANGPAVQSALEQKIPGIEMVNPEGGKGVRLEACEGLFEGGCVYFPPENLHPWVKITKHELTNFPTAAHDDCVDTTSQALLPLAKGDRLQELRAAMANM